MKQNELFTKIQKRNWLIDNDLGPTHCSDYIEDVKRFYNNLSKEIDTECLNLQMGPKFSLTQKKYLIELLIKMLMESYSSVLKCSLSGKMVMMQDT